MPKKRGSAAISASEAARRVEDALDLYINDHNGFEDYVGSDEHDDEPDLVAHDVVDTTEPKFNFRAVEPSADGKSIQVWFIHARRFPEGAPAMDALCKQCIGAVREQLPELAAFELGYRLTHRPQD